MAGASLSSAVWSPSRQARRSVLMSSTAGHGVAPPSACLMRGLYPAASPSNYNPAGDRFLPHSAPNRNGGSYENDCGKDPEELAFRVCIGAPTTLCGDRFRNIGQGDSIVWLSLPHRLICRGRSVCGSETACVVHSFACPGLSNRTGLCRNS